MHPNESLSLQVLQDELKQWRLTRTTRHIPLQVKARAVVLLMAINKSEVIALLRHFMSELIDKINTS